jgi:MFS family permease
VLDRLRRVFKAFTYRDFRLLWIGAFTSSVGTWMQTVAQNWLILTLTGSAFYLGLSAFLQEAPFLLFSLFGGVLADRVDRRRILLVSQVVQISSAFLLAGVVALGQVRVWHILVLSLAVGLAQSFGGPAYQALVPTLVDREDLPNAVALNSIQFNLARVIGPVLGGWAFYALGAAACFALNGVSFLAVIAALLLLRRGALLAAPEEASVLESLTAGVKAVHNSKSLRGLVGIAFLASFCALPLVTFLPVFAKDIFGGDAKGYSYLLAAFGLGAVGGAIAVAGLASVKHRGRVGVTMLAVFGALSIAFAASRVLALSYAVLFLAGAAMVSVFATFMTLVQTNVEEAMRGRVVSVYSLAFRGAMPLGNLVAGSLAAVVTAPWVLVGNGLLLMLFCGGVLLRGSRAGVLSL